MDLYQFLSHFHPITQESFHLLERELNIKSFKKGELIVKEGQIQRELYFVLHGVQMSYYDSLRNSHVIAFTYPPSLCAIPESFQFQKPSTCHLQCITDSELAAISFTSLNHLFDEDRELERLFRKITEHVLAGMIERHIELHSMTIEERYLQFCKRSAHLLQLVPHKYIASYLNINPTNFSKLYNTIKI